MSLLPRRPAVVLSVLGLLAVACGGSPAAVTATHGEQIATMQVDGVTRTYRVYYPPAIAASGRVPLLLALHGGQQYGDAMEQMTGFDSLAEADRFIVAYPNGHGRTWNAGTCCGFPNVSTDNEVHFIDALITRLSAGGRVDPSRVYVTGFSAGAAMTYTVACRLSNRVAAVASVAGTMDLDTCHPHMPVSVMEIHGTADLELLYGGGVVGQTGSVSPATPDIVARWASLDECAGAPETQTTGSVAVSRWTRCAMGTSVVLEAVQGGSHTWYAPQLGSSDSALDATDVIWRFLSSHHR